jgi:hypothetical protein
VIFIEKAMSLARAQYTLVELGRHIVAPVIRLDVTTFPYYALSDTYVHEPKYEPRNQKHMST